ncbi:MAG: D-aminoacylase [Sphaerochaetaceae bacterium]
MFDFLFTQANVIDGSGNPAYKADVAVCGEEITAIGKISPSLARHVVPSSGLVLCPGFVDMHGHSELQVLRDSSMSVKIRQGITSEVAGNCGIGVYPSGADYTMQKTLSRDVLGDTPYPYWKSFEDYKDTLARKGCGTNMAFLQSHSALRCAVLGSNPNRVATNREIEGMCSLLRQSFESGCVGFSSGLYYAPCIFADRRELLALLSVTKEYGRFFAVHHRCEGDEVLSSLQEVISLAQESGVRLEISHLKAIGRNNQDKVDSMLAMITRARNDGLEIAFDQYPYTYGSTSLFSLLPPLFLRMERARLQQLLQEKKIRSEIQAMMEHPEGWDSIYELAGFDQILILVLESNSKYQMMSIEDIAKQRHEDVFDTFFDLLEEEKGTALMADTTQSEESLIKILRHPLMCFGTDALYAGGLCHPRSYNAAIHLLDRYGRELRILPWEQLIHRMTEEGARRIGLMQRGLVKEGYKADLVLFDSASIKDNSSLANPDASATGLELVMINGQVAYKDKQCTGIIKGQPYFS